MKKRKSDYSESGKLKRKKLAIDEKPCENLLEKLKLCDVFEDEKVLKIFKRHTVEQIDRKSQNAFLKAGKRG